MNAAWNELDVAELDTPVLVVDRPRLLANLDAATSAAARAEVALRPHVKTHKSVQLARLQVERGATGLTVATVGEAEVLADAGFDDLFIAFPVRASGPKADRLAALAHRLRLRVGVESVDSARLLAAALRGTSAALLVELDSGGRRTGLASMEAALEVADAARRHGATIDGAFTHGGHSYAGPSAREGAAADEVRTLLRAGAALSERGHEVRVLSAGSTPTMLAAARRPVSEIRPGTYVFHDRLQVALGVARPNDVALVVATTVISRHRDRAVVDAGAKTLSKDVPSPLVGHGAVLGRPDLLVERVYDHHGVLVGPADQLPALGDVVWIVPNHVCPVVDLAPDLLVVDADGSHELWPVDARGRSR